MESKATSYFVLFSMKRLMTLRSPLTTSADVDQVPVMVLDEWVGGTRMAEGIVGRERTCDLESWHWHWLCHRLFGDCLR